MSVTEFFGSILIYCATGVYLLDGVLYDSSSAPLNAYILLLLYVSFGFLLARNVVMSSQRNKSVFDRAYAFFDRPYYVHSDSILLGPTSVKAKRSYQKNIPYDFALEEALAEFFFESKKPLNFGSPWYSFPLILYSYIPVPFNFNPFRKYPFTLIDMYALLPEKHYIDIELHETPFIKELVLPRTIKAASFSIKDCPSFRNLYIPCDSLIDLNLSNKYPSFSNLSPNFRIFVPEHLLSAYSSKYKDILIYHTDNTTSPLQFAPFPSTYHNPYAD